MQAYILDKTTTEMTILTADARFLRIPVSTENTEFLFSKTIFTPKKLVVCLAECERTRLRKRTQYKTKVQAAAAAALCKAEVSDVEAELVPGS